MKIKNRIINYFVVPPQRAGGMPRVFSSPVTISAIVAKELLTNKIQKETGSKIVGNLLRVCYDVSSGVIYVPNAVDFQRETMEPLLQMAKIRIAKDFGDYSSHPPIEGNPYNSIRIRSISSFDYASKLIKQHYNNKVFKDIPVIEAHLARMPGTLKTLPKEFKNEEYLGDYISPSYAKFIKFVDELDDDNRKRQKPIMLLTQKTPFILINISATAADKPSEKEWVVISGYRDYLYDSDASQEEEYIKGDINSFAELFSIKRLLYLGWTFEEVCSHFLNSAHNFGEMINSIGGLMSAVESLREEGKKDPASTPYYITFKIDLNDFPIKISSIIDPSTGKINPFKQYDYFRILEYDNKTGYILIESPVFISPPVCENILKAKSNPAILTYNPLMKKIDVKSDDKSYKDLCNEKRQKMKIESLIKRDLGKTIDEKIEFRTGPMAQGTWAINTNIFNIRKISDYLYTYDYLLKMSKDKNFNFVDLDVVIGPIERIFGRGVQGGFMDAKKFTDKEKQSLEGETGVIVEPPLIFINSKTMPSYAEQTCTLIHEYAHNIFGVQNPFYEKKYGDISARDGTPEYYKQWNDYFSDPNEVFAHKEQIKYELQTGLSTDEIIRNKVGGLITIDNFPVAIKFRELVDEAFKELEEDKKTNEQPTELDKQI